jgi:hypothetical protein
MLRGPPLEDRSEVGSGRTYVPETLDLEDRLEQTQRGQSSATPPPPSTPYPLSAMGLFDRFRKQDQPSEEVNALIAHLDDEAAEERLEACRALGNLGDAAKSAIPRLQDLLSDVDGDVCLAAANAISQIDRGF